MQGTETSSLPRSVVLKHSTPTTPHLSLWNGCLLLPVSPAKHPVSLHEEWYLLTVERLSLPKERDETLVKRPGLCSRASEVLSLYGNILANLPETRWPLIPALAMRRRWRSWRGRRMEDLRECASACCTFFNRRITGGFTPPSCCPQPSPSSFSGVARGISKVRTSPEMERHEAILQPPILSSESRELPACRYSRTFVRFCFAMVAAVVANANANASKAPNAPKLDPESRETLRCPDSSSAAAAFLYSCEGLSR